MPEEIPSQLKDYLDYRESIKGRPEDVPTLLHLYQKAREVGLHQEAKLHLYRAGELDPDNEEVKSLLVIELTPEEYQRWQAEHRWEIPFYRDIKNIVVYPAFSGALTRLTIAALALSLGRIFEDLMKLLPFLRIFSVPLFALGGLAWFFTIIILPGFYASIVRETARGSGDLPSWPGFADPWGEVVLPAVKSLVIFLWSFLPLGLVVSSALHGQARPSVPLLLISLLYGLLYFPMSFLSFSLSERLWPSLLPSQVVETMARTCGRYLRLVLLFWLLILPSILFLALWPWPIVGALIPTLAGLYCWTVAMRLLGRFYRLEAKSLEKM